MRVRFAIPEQAWNRTLAVGVLAAVTGAAFLVALTFFRKGGFSERDSYLVHAYFSDATGLTWKSRVQVAGIQIGEVDGITLEGAKARLDIRIKKGADLHADACLTKTFPSALLPDARIEVQPGSDAQPKLESLPGAQRRITCIREATSVQQILDSMAKIAADVQLVTSHLAQTVAGNQGLREIVENLASATKRIDETIAANEQNLSDILASTREFTADLREISGRDKEKIGRIFTNVEQLTARLRVVAAGLQEVVDPGSGAPDAAAPGGTAPNRRVPPARTPEERAQAQAEARGVRQAVDRLNTTLAKLDELVGKVTEGKSVAGRLLVDERLGRKVGNAAEDLADQFERVSRLQIQVQLRSEWLFKQAAAKSSFGARLLPRPDKYYLFEVVSDPRGVDSVTSEKVTSRDPLTGIESTSESTRTRNEQKLAYTLQIAKRYGPLTFRIGVIESSGGAGTDLHLLRDRLQLSASVYQFSRPRDALPRAKVWMNYYFLQHLYLTAGADDFLNGRRSGGYRGGPKFTIGSDVFVGGGLFFTDDDLKALVAAGLGGVISTRR